MTSISQPYGCFPTIANAARTSVDVRHERMKINETTTGRLVENLCQIDASGIPHSRPNTFTPNENTKLSCCKLMACLASILGRRLGLVSRMPSLPGKKRFILASLHTCIVRSSATVPLLCSKLSRYISVIIPSNAFCLYSAFPAIISLLRRISPSFPS